MNRLLLACCVALLAACGTRGPLFLPPDAATPAKPPVKAGDDSKAAPATNPK